MGLRHSAEKPATVLRFVYIMGWLPALVWGFIAPGRTANVAVIDGAGRLGAATGAALLASLAILTIGYLWALRRPPSPAELVGAAAGSVLVALAVPVLFSADAYAYAYYGDLLLHGRNPYGHGGPALADGLEAAARAAWGEIVPPRCVYGPLAVAIAAGADLVGAFGGSAGVVLAQRAAAVLAFGACIVLTLRLVADARARAAFILNPVVIWSVAEGHNDAAMLALVLAALLAPRYRELLIAAAVLVKAPALLAWQHRRPRWTALGAAGLVVLGYAPLAAALLRGPLAGGTPTADPAAWQSPLGVLAALLGRIPAVAVVAGGLVAAALAAGRLAPRERAAAFALAAWFSLPNAYPWYALWIVPLAARNLSSPWARALLTAAMCAPVRAVMDAIYPAADRLPAHGTFHLSFLAVEYLPPLIVLAATLRRRQPRLLTAALAVALGVLPISALAQATPQPIPTPTAAATPTVLPVPTPFPTPAPSVGTSPPAPLPSAAPPPSPLPTPTPSPTVEPTPVPTAPPTVNPFEYVITPSPAPVTTPDGPHILQVELNDRRIHAGGPLMVRVLTSPNVVGVEARALGRFIAIPQSSPGLFALAYTLPDGIPIWLLNRKYEIVIAAATADGRQTTVSFPMLLTR